MFVFKAAVVGAGVMGGEIAQVIAAADIPVVRRALRDALDRTVRRFGHERRAELDPPR